MFSQWFAIWDKDGLQPIVSKDKQHFQREKQMLTIINDEYKLLHNAWKKLGAPDDVDGYVLIELRNDPLERKNIYNEKPEVIDKMKQALSTWFNKIKAEKTSYASPVFQIGWHNKKISDVLAYGPYSLQGTRNENFDVTEMDNIGDRISYKINVKKAGRYNITMHAKNTMLNQLIVEVKCNKQSQSKHLTGNKTQSLGTFDLSEGEQIFSVEVIDRKSEVAAAEGSITKFQFEHINH